MSGASRFHVNRDLLVYKVFYFLFLSGFGSIFPYLPVYFRQMGLPASQVGLLVGVRPIVQFASAPFWAIVADKYRKRKAVLVMSILAWLIMTLSLAFVEPTNEICEVRAGNGSDIRVVNYTKMKTGFFKRRSLLVVQEEGVNNADDTKQSPDLVVVRPVSIPSPKLLTNISASVEKTDQSGSGQDQGIFLSGSADHDFVHDKRASSVWQPLKTKHRGQIGLVKDWSSNEMTKSIKSNAASSRKSRKATWTMSQRKNSIASQGDKPAAPQGKRNKYFKTATRSISDMLLVNKQRSNTSDPSTPIDIKTTETQKHSEQQVVKNVTQTFSSHNGAGLVRKSADNSSEASETVGAFTGNELGVNRQLTQEKKNNSTNGHHKPDEKRKNTRNDKSVSPPVVIEFSRILIPQEKGEEDQKSLFHNASDTASKMNKSAHTESDNAHGAFSSEMKEPKAEKDATTVFKTSESLVVTGSERKSKSKGNHQSTLQQSILYKITNASSSYGQLDLNDSGLDKSPPRIHSNTQHKGLQFGSGDEDALDLVLQKINNSPDDVGKQSVHEDRLHKEQLDSMGTKLMHHTKGLVLDSTMSKTWANATNSGTTLDEPHSDSDRLHEEIADINPVQINTTTRIDEENISGKVKDTSLMGGKDTGLLNKTEGSAVAVTTVVVSSKSKMKIQITNAHAAVQNDSEAPVTINMVAEPMSDEDESEESTISNALLTTKNLLKENTSELKRIFTILLVLIVVGEFLEAPSFTLADASLLEHLGEERRYYGKQRLWGSLGFGIFSFLVGVLLEKSGHVVCGEEYTDYMICFCVFAIFMVMTLLFVSTTFNFQYKEAEVEHSSVMYALCNVHYGSCLFAACFMGVGHGMSHNFVNWFLEDLGGSKTLMGIAVICRCTADLLTFFVAGSLIKYVGQIGLMVASLISYGIAYASYSLLSNPWWVLPVEALNGITYAASWSACTSYMAGAVSPESVTTVQGILQGVYWGLGTGSGTIVGGYLIHHVGPVLTFRLTSCSYFVVCVLFCIAQFKWTKDTTDPASQAKYTYLPTVKTKDTEALLSGYGTHAKRPAKHRSSKY